MRTLWEAIQDSDEKVAERDDRILDLRGAINSIIEVLFKWLKPFYRGHYDTSVPHKYEIFEFMNFKDMDQVKQYIKDVTHDLKNLKTKHTEVLVTESDKRGAEFGIDVFLDGFYKDGYICITINECSLPGRRFGQNQPDRYRIVVHTKPHYGVMPADLVEYFDSQCQARFRKRK